MSGFVTPILDQSTCGSCAAHAASSTIESCLAIASSKQIPIIFTLYSIFNVKIHSPNQNPSNSWWTVHRVFKLEKTQSWRGLTKDVKMASLMSTWSGFRRLRILIRLLETILFDLLSQQESASILDMALTTSTTS